MKILVISLLRLGDVILSTPVLRGLREKHPDAEVHVLINKQFESLSGLLPFVEKVHHFDRGALQDGLGSADKPLFEPYERLRDLIEELNGERFDQVINLTHNRLSGWVAHLIEAPVKLGLSFDNQGRPSYGSSWFRYLNSRAEAEGEDTFHYIDIFTFGSGLAKTSAISLMETDRGRAEAEALIAPGREFVLVQPLTSDVKKDWGLANFGSLLEIFHSTYPKVESLVLGAENERPRLEAWVESLKAKGVPARLAICGLETAYSLLRQARALVTGDTGIKHLACAAQTPLLELSLGSSDYRRTGAYAQNSVIIQSKELCAPCVHSKPCHRDAHHCARRIEPECAAMAFGCVFRGDLHQLRTIAEEYKSDVVILRTDLRGSGFWTAYPLAEPFSEGSVSHWVDLMSWKILLETQQAGDPFARVGAESSRLGRFLQKIYPDVSDIEWKHLLAEMERQAESVHSRTQGFQRNIRMLAGTYENPRRMRAFVQSLIAFREKLRQSPFLASHRSSLDAVIEDEITPSFVRFRRIVNALNEIQKRSEIEVKMLRSLQMQMEA